MLALDDRRSTLTALAVLTGCGLAPRLPIPESTDLSEAAAMSPEPRRPTLELLLLLGLPAASLYAAYSLSSLLVVAAAYSPGAWEVPLRSPEVARTGWE